MRRWSLLPFAFLLAAGSSAQAQSFNFIDAGSLSGLLPQDVANSAVQLFGVLGCHRPYQGATPITRYNSFDLNIEVTLMHLGSELSTALTNAGVSAGALNTVPALPMPKLNIRKALGNNSDIGLSGILYKGVEIIGGDIRFLLAEPEEGINIAMRVGYTYIDGPALLYIRSESVESLEFVASRPLEYAEPYIGVGARYMSGTVDVPYTASVTVAGQTLSQSVDLIKSGTAFDAYAFTGVYFHIIGPTGLRWGLEGSYDLMGYHTMGTVIGVGF